MRDRLSLAGWVDEHVSVTRAELAALLDAADRLAAVEAARFAYAKEFAPNEDGEPDVGSIHENIRKLKAELAALKARIAEAPAVEIDTTLDAVTGAYAGYRFPRGMIGQRVRLLPDDAVTNSSQPEGRARE